MNLFYFLKEYEKLLILITLWISIFIGLFLSREILLPFFLAILLAFVLHPLVTWMHGIRIRKRQLARWLCVLIVYLGLLGILALLGLFVLPQLYTEANKVLINFSDFYSNLDQQTVDSYILRIGEWMGQYHLPIRLQHHPDGEAVLSADSGAWFSLDLHQLLRQTTYELSLYIKSRSTAIVSQLQHVIAGTFRFILQLMLMLMVTAFILADIDSIKRFLFNLVPVDSKRDFDAFLARLDRGLSGVIRGQFLICLINGMLTLVGLLVLKVKFAFLLATIAGILSLIPIFGSIISTIPIALIAVSESLAVGILAVLWIVGIHALEANFLNPKIMGNAAKIHPTVVILALLIGEHFYGLLGALLAMPIASILITIFQSLLQRANAADESKTKSV